MLWRWRNWQMRILLQASLETTKQVTDHVRSRLKYICWKSCSGKPFTKRDGHSIAIAANTPLHTLLDPPRVKIRPCFQMVLPITTIYKWHVSCIAHLPCFCHNICAEDDGISWIHPVHSAFNWLWHIFPALLGARTVEVLTFSDNSCLAGKLSACRLH